MRNTITALVLLLALNASAQTNYSPNKIYYQDNIPTGTFEISGWTKKYNVDADGDGIQDIVAMTGTEITVYTAVGNGGFTATTVSAGAYGFPNYGATAGGDLNNDGKLDFVWYNLFSNDLVVSYWSGIGSDYVPTYTTPARLNIPGLGAFDGSGDQMGLYGLNTADIDSDGDVDILGFGPNGIQLPHMIINNGDGTFTRYDLHPEAAYHTFSQVTDWNGDGRQDVLVSENGGIVLYTNDGNSGTPSVPSFTKTILVNAAAADNFDAVTGYFDVVDFNQDGQKDILLNASSFDFNTFSNYYFTRVFINTTTAPPAYTFAATELQKQFGYPAAVIGGFGARYEDIDGNGVLDVIGICGRNTAQPTRQLGVTLFSINGQNLVSATQATLMDRGPLTVGFGHASLNMMIDDVDGDNQRDYMIGYSNYPNVLLYRTRFPHFSQSGLTDFQLENKVFVGGSNTDVITLTVSATGGAGSLWVPNDNGALITNNGTLAVTLQGTVEQINYCLASTYFTPANNATYQLNFSVTNAFSETFTNSLQLTHGGIILPVQGLTLTATKKEGVAIVNWQTLSEQHALDFLVQHSSNGAAWTTIGTVTANGNTTGISSYHFVHQQPVKGTNFYRLIQRDHNGRFVHSNVATLAWNSTGNALTIYPNPVVGKKLSVVLEEAATLQVFDSRGQMILQQTMQKGLHQLNLSRFASGVYLIQAGKAQQKVMVP
jgi:hypothetical protein